MLMIWLGLAAVLVLVGIAGTLLPGLPGLPLVAVGLALAAWAEGFQFVSGWTVFWIALIALVGVLLDLVLGLLGPKMTGASRWAVVGATVGAVVGLLMGLVGILFMPFVGAMLAEFLYRKNLGQAARAGLGAWLGLLAGAAIKVAALASMLALYLLARFWGH